jgi:hypothetical protein
MLTDPDQACVIFIFPASIFQQDGKQPPHLVGLRIIPLEPFALCIAFASLPRGPVASFTPSTARIITMPPCLVGS